VFVIIASEQTLETMTVKDWLIDIGLAKEAENYAQLFEQQKYLTLNDLITYPPNENDQKYCGILAGKHRKQIIRLLSEKYGITGKDRNQILQSLRDMEQGTCKKN